MKKLVFAAVAAIALMASVSFVSCDKKAAPAVDSTAIDTVETVVEEFVDSFAADSTVADTTVAE